MPDQCFDGFDLAEIERVQAAGLRVAPVLQQLARHGGHARVAGRAPGIDPLADPVDEFQFDTANRVVAGVEDLVAGGAAAFPKFKPMIAGPQPVMGGALEGGADDQ